MGLCNLLKISFVFLFFLSQNAAIEIEGRLPGEFFREDNPARFGAVMSLTSVNDSMVLLHVTAVKPDFTIAQQLRKIARGFKIGPNELKKQTLVEGNLRWLQYFFQKKNKSGGFVYITRNENWLVYLIIFNVHAERLASDLPFIERYIQQLKLAQP